MHTLCCPTQRKRATCQARHAVVAPAGAPCAAEDLLPHCAVPTLRCAAPRAALRCAVQVRAGERGGRPGRGAPQADVAAAALPRAADHVRGGQYPHSTLAVPLQHSGSTSWWPLRRCMGLCTVCAGPPGPWHPCRLAASAEWAQFCHILLRLLSGRPRGAASCPASPRLTNSLLAALPAPGGRQGCGGAPEVPLVGAGD